jgi:tetratricopeptide (TPR) repeat protein
MTVRTSSSVSYSMWLRRILDAHIAQAWNTEPTDIHEREDDELNDLWTEIDDRQKQRLWGLSSDLNSLRDRETFVDADWSPMTRKELANAQSVAFQAKDWDTLLEYLRRPPRFHQRDTVDYLRGRAWQEMGYPEVAVLFFDNARRLGPQNPAYGFLALECLKAMEAWPEVLRRFDACMRDPTTPAQLLFRAADAVRVYASSTGEHTYYEKSVNAVDEGFRRLGQPGQQEPLDEILAGAYGTKSICLERLDRTTESLQVYDEAIQRFPENTTLLIARGFLEQELGLSDAVDDFRHAVDRGTSVAWAYIELARDELQKGRNPQAIDFCRRSIPLAQRDATTPATLFELLAIAMLRQNEPLDTIRAAFRRAGELDPLSEEIRINRERFESFAGRPDAHEPEWQLPSKPPRLAIEDVFADLLQPAA